MGALLRYQRWFVVGLAMTLAVAAGLTSWVNPWRVTPATWSGAGFEHFRAIDNRWNRTAKAGLVRSGGWDAAIFGSSRVDIAFDPCHPAFAGMRCANLGLNAAGIDENHAIFRYFIEREPARFVVFCIDPGDLTTPWPAFNRTDFAVSPLAPDANRLERELRYRVGIPAIADSLAVIARRLRGQPADHTPQGFRRFTPFPENQRALIASLYLATTHRLAMTRIAANAVNPGKLALVDDLIRQCRARNVRLAIVIPPNHALFQLAFRELGDPDPWFARDRTALAHLVAAANAADPAAQPVELWDFLDAHPLNCPPLPPADPPGAHFENWIDLFHSTPQLGARILDRLAHPDPPPHPSPPYGTRLTPDALADHLARIAAGLDQHARNHPADRAFLRTALQRFHDSKPIK